MDDQETTPKRQSTFPIFSKSFITRPQEVVEYSGAMNKQMQDFIDAFKKRIQLEFSYARQLATISKALDKYIKPGTELGSSFVCSAFKVEHEQRSRQAQELAQSLKTQIQTQCMQVWRQNTTNYKKMQKQVKKFIKQSQTFQSNYVYGLQKYQHVVKQIQQNLITRNNLRFTTTLPQDKKNKMIGRILQQINNNKQYEKMYLSAAKDYNAFVDIYNTQIRKHLDQAQQQVRDQMTLQGNCLRKLIVAEVSMFKNIQYDLLNISKQMELLDTQKDVEIFHQEKMSNVPKQQPEKEKQKEKDDDDEVSRKSLKSGQNLSQLQINSGNDLKKKEIIGKSLLNQSLNFADQDYLFWMLKSKKNAKMQDLVSKIWKLNKRQLKQNGAQNNSQNEQKTQQNRGYKEAESEVTNVQQNQQSEENKEIAIPKQQTVQKASQTKQETPSAAFQQQIREFLASLQLREPSNSSKKSTISKQTLQEPFLQISKLITSLWNSTQTDQLVIAEGLMALQKHLSTHFICRLFAFLLIQTYRSLYGVNLASSTQASVCGQILRTIISQSSKQNDVFIVRCVLGLIFTFYWTEQSGKKLLYQSSNIPKCQIWKKNDFWQAAIFQTSFQKMSEFAMQKGQTQAESSLRQKNMIFSHLASFCHNMVMLGISNKNVRIIVGRYCRLYEMSEDQNRDLSKMIKDTSKQYKDYKDKSTIGGVKVVKDKQENDD